MILDTSGIREGHSAIRQSSDLDAVKDSLPPFAEKVSCEASVERSGATIYAHIHFKGSFEQQCARCLLTYHFPVSGDFNLILEEKDGRCGAAREDETADFYFNTHDYLVDISPAIYDEIMISLPLKPLCNDACKGIAVEYEQVKSSASSDVDTGYDPRWEALRKLQKKM